MKCENRNLGRWEKSKSKRKERKEREDKGKESPWKKEGKEK